MLALSSFFDIPVVNPETYEFNHLVYYLMIGTVIISIILFIIMVTIIFKSKSRANLQSSLFVVSIAIVIKILYNLTLSNTAIYGMLEDIFRIGFLSFVFLIFYLHTLKKSKR